MKDYVCREELTGGIYMHSEYKPVRELVRCKDCIHRIKVLNGDMYCDVIAIGYEKKVTDDWFCADGERE